LRKAMDADPRYPYNPMWLAVGLDDLGRTNESVPYYEKACALEPNGHEEILYLARHYLILEDNEAVRYLTFRSMSLHFDARAENYLGVSLNRARRTNSGYLNGKR
jgi:Flp pilus assembly protein TadD